MKKKSIGLLLVVGMLAAVMALPASAAAKTDVGVFAGQATVGQDRGSDPTKWCKPDGTAQVGGTGLPMLGNANKAYYKIDTLPGAVISAGRGTTGSLKFCGTLNPTVTSPVQAGASCITTQGTDGQGIATFGPTDKVYISNLGWAATAGGTFAVTGKAGSAPGDQGSNLVALVQALDDAVVLNCLGAGATVFNVEAAYAIV